MDDRHRELWTRWAALIVLALAELSTSSAQELHLPLPVEEVARMHYFASDDTPIGFSPDGRWLTYTIISPDEVRVPIGFTEFHTATGVPFLFDGASVWVSNLKSKQAIRLMDAGSNSWGGSWSPDGRLLAFYSDRGGQAGLWVWEKATGKSRRITEAIARPSRGSDVPQWMPDSKHVIIRVLPKGMTIEKANSFAPTGPASQASSDETASAIVVYKSPAEDKSGNPPESTWLSRRYLGDLVQIDVITGTVSAIVHSATAIAYSVSPDGTNLAIAEYRKHRVASQQSLYALKVVL